MSLNFLTPAGAIDGHAVARAIRLAYLDRKPFIDGYSGEAKAFWQKSIRAQVSERVIREARWQEHQRLFAPIAKRTPLTAQERERVAQLAFASGIAPDPTSIHYAEIMAARHELAVIRERATRRAVERAHHRIAIREASRIRQRRRSIGEAA